MAGQIWSVPADGGYLYSDQLSKVLRMQVQPLTKFRQFCDAKDGTEKGLNTGDKFYWNVTANVGRQGRALNELEPMPETNFTLTQKSVTVTEYGQAVPYTGKLTALAKQDVVEIIDQSLKHDARKLFDIRAFLEFKRCKVRVAPASGTSTTAITVTENGATATTNNVEMGTGHVKAISDAMKERNIVPYGMSDDYYAISHPTTYRTFKNSLETIHQYTDQGLGMIMRGEIGRYENTRFIEQTFIPKGGANDSTTFDPYTGTADAWNNAKSSWAFFFGGDTCIEAIVIPEEIRAKLPGDYGRSKGIAWYFLGEFALVHDDATNCRIAMWDSAA